MWAGNLGTVEGAAALGGAGFGFGTAGLALVVVGASRFVEQGLDVILVHGVPPRAEWSKGSEEKEQAVRINGW